MRVPTQCCSRISEEKLCPYLALSFLVYVLLQLYLSAKSFTRIWLYRPKGLSSHVHVSGKLGEPLTDLSWYLFKVNMLNDVEIAHLGCLLRMTLWVL